MIKIEVKLLVLHHMMIQVHGAIFAFPTGRSCIKKKIIFTPTDIKTCWFLRESEGKKKSVGFWGVKSTKDYVHRLENCKRSRIFCCCSSWCLLTYFLLHSSVFFLSLYLCRFSKNVWAQVNNFKTLHRGQVSILFKVQLENNLSYLLPTWSGSQYGASKNYCIVD